MLDMRHRLLTQRALATGRPFALSPQQIGSFMFSVAQAASRNLLIQAMHSDDFALLLPHLDAVPLDHKRVLASANRSIEHVYFPEGGIVSLTAMSENTQTEVGIVGHEGFAGIAILLGCDRSPHEVFVQVEGKALRIGVDPFTRAVAQSASLQALLLRFVQVSLIQSAQSTVANAQHNMESRLARWLLMCQDRIDEDEINLTHEFMSMMISAQRTGVTVCLHILEGAGMIRSRRARVEIVDREKLVELAGDAYGTPEAEYRRLIGPFGRTAEG